MKHRYCSSCRHSKYILIGDIRRLLCKQRSAFGQNPYIDTACTDAEVCLDYDPERQADNYKSVSRYEADLHKCGLTFKDARRGVLKDTGPRV